MAKQLDTFKADEVEKKNTIIKMIDSGIMKLLESYDEKFEFIPWKEGDSPLTIKTTTDLVRCLESTQGKDIELDCRFYVYDHKERKAKLVEGNKELFLSTYKGNTKTRFRESIDEFQYDITDFSSGGSFVGSPDYTPLIGGPFAKTLYYWDFLQQANAAFYAANNDCFGKRALEIMVDFVIGKGFRYDSDDKDALAMWDSFCQVNDMQKMIRNFVREEAIYGEHMFYWLPNKETKINYRPAIGQPIDHGQLPRIRLLDPTTIWEVITDPMDITNVMAYQQVFPTQYQIYTAQGQPATKFVYQQLPADAVMHYKINVCDNEKRGRSDLYAALGYMKRMRDLINYEMVRAIKNSAYCQDTEVDGDQTDIDAYIKAINDLGAIPKAGADFVHSTKVKRQYLSAPSNSGSNSPFEIMLSCLAAATGCPVTYFGTHLSQASVRAGAVTATEPVAKRHESRQHHVEDILLDIKDAFFKKIGWKGTVAMEFTFPEIFTQDRSAKLQDLALCRSELWFTEERCAAMAAKEFGITDFDPEDEIQKVKSEPPPPEAQQVAPPNSESPMGVTSEEKTQVKAD